MSPGRRFVTDQRTIACARGKIHREPLDRLMTVPGPGTYDAPTRQAAGDRFHDGPGIMSTGGGRESLPPLGSNLPPGTYDIPSSIDQLLQKVVSLKGPYAIFTGSRNSPVCVGSGHLKTDIHVASQKMKNLGPGAYNPYPAKWESPHRSFRKVTEVEREHIRNRTSKPVYPPLVNPNGYPGPGQYDVNRSTLRAAPARAALGAAQQEAAAADGGAKAKTSVPLSLMAINKALMWKCQYGFNSTTMRKDKFTHERWGYSANPVGVGRYNVADASERLVHVNGHCSVFNSACERNVFTAEMPELRAARSWERERARKSKKLELVRTRLLGPVAPMQPPLKQAGSPAPAAPAAAALAVAAAAGVGEQRK